jgi:PAS domain S-box-containing protein
VSESTGPTDSPASAPTSAWDTGAILEAVSFAAERVFSAPWREGIDQVLQRLGQAAGLSRVYLFENVQGGDADQLQRLSHEWTASGIPSLSSYRFHRDPAEQPAPEAWRAVLARGEMIHTLVRDLPEPERSHFAEEGVLSIVAAPVFAGGGFWGEIGFDDCARERAWTGEEVQALRTAAAILGASIHHEREEANVRDAEARYRTLVEQIPAVVYIDAVQGPSTTLYISPQTEEMLGLAQRDWMDDPQLLSKHVHPEDRQRWRESVDHADATGDPLSLEYRIVAPDGRVVWVHDEAVLVKDGRGLPQFWHGAMFDITERRTAEQALLEAFQREREAAGRLRTLDEMKNTFLQAVSHELRTPLTSILGSALTLERADLELTVDDTRGLVRGIASNARKLYRLLSDLLDLDRLGRGIVEPNRQPTDVAALARGVLDEVDVLGDRPVHVDAPSLTLAVDAAKVERIVENLLVNAARHTPEGTDVWLRVLSQDGGVVICVEDAGPGVPEHLRETIFEPFRQAAANRPHAPGVGVGLALVARFAELHGGNAWVQERVGGGASFRVFLPGDAEAGVA